MLKLGVIADGISRDLEHALGVIREVGFDHAELQYVWDKEIGDQTPDELRRIKQLLSVYDMKVPCISRHIFTGAVTMQTSLKDPLYLEQLDAFRRCIDIAKALDTPHVRIFSGRKEAIVFGENGAEVWNVATGAWDALVERVRPFVAIAEDAETTIALESAGGGMVNSAWMSRKLIDEIGSDRLRVLWDPGNNCWAHETAYPDGYDQIAGLIAHIHMKDVVVDTPKATLRSAVFGSGDLADQFAPLADALRRDRYDGVISFESVYRPNGGSFEDGFRHSVDRFKAVFGADHA